MTKIVMTKIALRSSTRTRWSSSGACSSCCTLFSRDWWRERSSWLRSSEAYPKVKDYAQKALILDDALPEAYVASNLPNLMYSDRNRVDLASRERSLKRAIELDPSLPEAHAAYGNYLTLSSRPQESFEQFKAAMQLDPLWLEFASEATNNYVGNHEFEQAIRTAKAALEVDPHFFPALVSLEYTYESAGRVEDALVLQEQNMLHSPEMLAAKRAAFNREGEWGYWLATVETWASGDCLWPSSRYRILSEADRARIRGRYT
jgi:tetratricopeptide (TPR) repeat protein